MNQIGLGNLVTNIDDAQESTVTIKNFSCASSTLNPLCTHEERAKFKTLLKSITVKDDKKNKTGRKPRNRPENLPAGGSIHRDDKKRDKTVRKRGEKREVLQAGGSSQV